METIALTNIEMTYQQGTRQLTFTNADLFLVTDFGSALWYVDANGIADADVLKWFNQSEDIRIELRVTSLDNRKFEGTAYFHPNEKHYAAAIRGEGELRLINNEQ
ncbi:hypothetical protein BBD42_18140 [Paenibacillus sp. BIHB 4019]|uniref:Uncharacterized protein n=1 Tax=Paenibacillus sp. BIHB 4019 TaxID=1870819 RepID=A0A1B2DKD3_9BACL|nr:MULTISPECIES: hypothetical protein [unclassified Paenibacillus]ANY68180.1 hypothetical protein BBD42_18140 [Paenibacillus sp. BIHB 4019]KQO14643.1 hypothetical protein ASF12_28630 [Paenibacillus sp. Leaf72]